MAFREQSVVLFIILVIFSDIAACDKNVFYRLPNNTVPEYYHIHITTKLEKDNFKFTGICTINIKVLVETKTITLHSKLGQIDKLDLWSSENEEIIKPELTKENDFLILTVSNNLKPTERYTIKIWYSSKLRNDKLGFYRDSYYDQYGRKVWLAATQFAPTEARHAFPCYDEPNRKAKFELEITHPTKMIAISNADSFDPIINTDGTSTTKFKPTKVMSTYLVGFVISNLEKILAKTPEFLHEIYVRPNRPLIAYNSGKIAQQLWINITNYFEEKYPDEVIKHVVLPNSHFSGMENWGLITYKENEFLFDSTKYSLETKVKVTSLIGKELAHSWFGNLVTMQWWTYNWLKDGFSTLFGYYAAEMGWPYSNFIEIFTVEKMLPVLKFDGTINTRPMTHYVEKPNEIMKSFDEIASNKAASVLRMLEHAFGKSTFKTAVNNFLKNKKYDNANEDDLIASFTQVLPNFSPTVESIIKSWTLQSGYPVVTVTRDYDTSSVTIEQERFMNNGDVEKAPLWHIPINFEKANASQKFTNTSPEFWMTERIIKLKGNGKDISLDPSEWIIFNKMQTGYYRVNYDLNNWELIIQALRDDYSNINVFNRAQLIDDSFSLAAAGRLNFSIPLKLIKYMGMEPSFAPWGALSTHVKNLKRHSQRTKIFVSLSKYLSEIAHTQIAEVINKAGGDSLIRMTYNQVLSIICDFDITKCPVADPEFAEKPELRSYHYCYKMHKYGNLTYIELRNLLRKEEDFHLRRDILSSFGCAQTKGLLSFFLSSTLEVPSDLKLTNTERVHLLKSIYQNGEWGLNITIAFITREWKTIDSLLPDLLDEIIPDLAKYVISYPVQKIFNLMITKIKMLKSTTLIEANAEITNNLRWIIMNEPDIETFLKIKSSSVNHFISLWTLILFSILAFVL